MKQHYAERIVDICTELAVPADGSSSISGVDGDALSERYLCGRKVDCSPQNLRKTCLLLGMDCSTLVFYGSSHVEWLSQSGRCHRVCK
ncbi:hypothetical protein B0T10DRAFT_141129 [Thelonectria olida]|uniref:Uncharacterized protein n=1 Tax=Thelonectria olida TaxID=1576542 RepID=A0A9P8VWN4_9HYPO|nr:hypothetical protein B0T10DRAFT_141129 [Thelonectria olida]